MAAMDEHDEHLMMTIKSQKRVGEANTAVFAFGWISN